MCRKILSILISILILFSILTVYVRASEDEVVVETSPDTEPADTPSTGGILSPTPYNIFMAQVEAYSTAGYENTLSYSPDSVISQGVSLNTYTDTVKLELGFIISTDLPIGVEIYDDPSTPIIEGIRVNGETVTDLKVPINLIIPEDYFVDVRLVYSDGLAGTIAKISNGEFDWNTILEEPLLAMQLLYYVIAALSIIIGGFGIATSKRKKVKTADEIASQVDARVKEGCEIFAIQYADLLKSNMLPVFNTVVDTNKAVVKAITLSTSKSKEAPVALLDVLKAISDVDVEKDIDNARQEVLKNIANTDAKRAAMRATLATIAQGTYQEVHDANPSPSQSGHQSQTTQKTSEADEIKSVF